MTVVKSLENWFGENDLSVPVHHVHMLMTLEEIKEITIRERKDPSQGLEHIRVAQELRNQIRANIHSRWNVISLTRGPTARNISFFFHTLKDYIPDWAEKMNNNQLSIDQLQTLFFSIDSIHRTPERWFDGQLKGMTGFDVYCEPFPWDRGYQVYRPNEKFNILVMRLEDLNRCIVNAMSDYLGMKNFTMLIDNIGQGKDYYEAYRIFRSKALPKDYVDRMYSLKYTKHFYSPDEIAQFRKSWLSEKM